MTDEGEYDGVSADYLRGRISGLQELQAVAENARSDAMREERPLWGAIQRKVVASGLPYYWRHVKSADGSPSIMCEVCAKTHPNPNWPHTHGSKFYCPGCGSPEVPS